MRFPRSLFFLLATGLTPLGLMMYGSWCVAGSIHRDFNRRPPSEAFELFFQRLVPADVRDLTAAGECWLGGSNVWLRFRAGSATLESLTSAARKVEPWKKGEGGIRDDAATLIRYDVPGRIGWKSVWKLKNADYYAIGEGHPSTEFVIDRDNGTVYAFYYGI